MKSYNSFPQIPSTCCLSKFPQNTEGMGWYSDVNYRSRSYRKVKNQDIFCSEEKKWMTFSAVVGNYKRKLLQYIKTKYSWCAYVYGNTNICHAMPLQCCSLMSFHVGHQWDSVQRKNTGFGYCQSESIAHTVVLPCLISTVFLVAAACSFVIVACQRLQV